MALEESPHALIAWKEDNKREKVPLTFVYRFPKSWSKVAWDKQYEYFVFWSPDEDDSPQSMLKRVAEIPFFEAGTGREQAGYHRAVVLMVKESLAELDAAASKKRTPVSLQTFTSFDDPKKAEEAKEPRNKPQGKTISKPKPVILKKGANKKKKSKSKGINLSATVHNAGPDLSESIAKHFNLNAAKEEETEEDVDNVDSGSSKDGTVIDRPASPSIETLVAPPIIKKEPGIISDKKTPHASSKSASLSTKTEPAHSLKLSPSPIMKMEPASSNVPLCNKDSSVKSIFLSCRKSQSSSFSSPVSPDTAQKTDFDGRTGLLVSKSPDSDHEKKKKKPSKPAVSSSSSSSEDSDSDSSSSSSVPIIPKKIKKRKHSSSSDEVDKLDNGEAIDPDFTPRKYVRLREDLDIERQQVKRVLNLNMNLQSKLLDAEQQVESSKQELESKRFEVERMKAKVAKLEKELKQLKSKTQDSHRKETPVDLNLTPSPAAKRAILTSPSPTSSRAASNLTPGKEADFKSPASSPVLSAKIQSSSPSTLVKTASKPASTTSADPTGNLDDDWDSGDVAHFCDAQLSGEESNPSNTDLKVDIVKPLIDLGIEFSNQRLQAIKSIPRGEKADSRFVKDLLVITFGPEVLASCSKDGSKRGGKKRSKEDSNSKEKKPALDKTKLAAVKEVFLRRVRAEGEQCSNPEALERTNSATFYKALTGAQRRCRTLGYGQGTKTNECDNSDLFSFM